VSSKFSVKVLYHIPDPDSLGAARWICDGWRRGFREVGHEFHLLVRRDSLRQRVEVVKPDLFITAIDILDVASSEILKTLSAMRSEGTKIAIWVHWPLVPSIDPRRAEVLKRADVADLYFGEREAEQMERFTRDTGKEYHVIPHAADNTQHPVAPVPKYRLDIAYLGANLPTKRWLARTLLPALRRRYRVGIFGPGWTFTDELLGYASAASRKLHAGGIATQIDRARIAVPPEEEAALYSSATISLNFHEREADGSQPHYIVNQRTFKIPACGGLELCDYVPAIRNYFDEDELVMLPLSLERWLQTIDYLLKHPAERERIRVNGVKRALRDHTYKSRITLLLRLLALQECSTKVANAAVG
jgi:spore maturation protein CgeB